MIKQKELAIKKWIEVYTKDLSIKPGYKALFDQIKGYQVEEILLDIEHMKDGKLE